MGRAGSPALRWRCSLAGGGLCAAWAACCRCHGAWRCCRGGVLAVWIRRCRAGKDGRARTTLWTCARSHYDQVGAASCGSTPQVCAGHDPLLDTSAGNSSKQHLASRILCAATFPQRQAPRPPAPPTSGGAAHSRSRRPLAAPSTGAGRAGGSNPPTNHNSGSSTGSSRPWRRWGSCPAR